MTLEPADRPSAGVRTTSAFAEHWTLDPAVAYLNHGPFGACPRAVLDYQQSLRARLEREPIDFLVRALPGLMSETRAALGAFVGADPEGIVFVPNATTAVNAVLRTWDFASGDQILTTDHTYGACRKAAEFVAARRNVEIVVARVSFPLSGSDDVADPVMAAVTPRTRLALLDHVTSPTAVIFPIDKLVGSLRERGVETIVDGAHALGMLPLALDHLGAACYTANAHKWLCAPKGAAMLHVRSDLRNRMRPLVISHAYVPGSDAVRFREEWDWPGTIDPTPHLSIVECLRFLGSLLPGGWPALMEHNHALAIRSRSILLEALGVRPPCPETMVGTIASVPLPAAQPGSPAERLDQDQLAWWMRERGVETWFFPWDCPGRKLVRISAQIYNHDDQYARLASLLTEALRAG